MKGFPKDTWPNENTPSHQLERLLVSAERAGDQQSVDEIMWLLYARQTREAEELAEAARHGAYPAWMYEEVA